MDLISTEKAEVFVCCFVFSHAGSKYYVRNNSSADDFRSRCYNRSPMHMSSIA